MYGITLWKTIAALCSVTCHMGLHDVTCQCHPTEVNAPHHNPSETDRCRGKFFAPGKFFQPPYCHNVTNANLNPNPNLSPNPNPNLNPTPNPNPNPKFNPILNLNPNPYCCV